MTEFIFLASLVLVGSWIVYEDVRWKIIKNYHLIILILIGIFLNYITGTFFDNPSLALFNIFLGVVAGLVIWLAGLWSAADAKLYISLVILFPVSWYKFSSGYFPGLAILINSTLPLFLFLALLALVKTNLKEKIQTLRKILQLPFLFRLFITILGLLLLRGVIFQLFKINLNYFLVIPLFLGMFWLIEDKFKIQLTYFFISVILFTLIFFPFLMFDLRFFLTAFTFWLLFLLGLFIMYLSFFIFTEEIRIAELKKGMILAEVVSKEGRKYVKRPAVSLTFFAGLRERMKLKPLFGYNPDGLKLNEIKKIQQLEKGNYLKFNTIKVAQTFPFAPVLILGSIITYFLKGSLIEILALLV